MYRRSLSLLGVTLLIAGCGGGGGTASPAISATVATQQTAPVSINLIVPPKATAQSVAGRKLKYVSPSTLSLGVTIGSSTGATEAPQYFACSTQSCSATLQAPVGNDTVALSLSDAPNGGGNVLAITGATQTTVQSGQTTTLNLVLNGVVDHVLTHASASQVVAGVPSTIALTVDAYDVDNNLIVGPGAFANAYGRPLTLSLGVVNTQDGGSGAFTLSSPALSSPSNTGVTASYNGFALDHAAITVTPSASIAGSVQGVTIAATPTAYETTLPSAASGPNGIAAGADGNLWVLESNTNEIARVTPAGVVTEFTNGITSGAGLVSITSGPDGNLWFTESSGNKIGKITTSGVVTEYDVTTSSSRPYDITTGPDGNLWFTEFAGSKIAKITTAGVVTEFGNGISMNAEPEGIAGGPDGNLWFTESGTSKIGRSSVGGTITEFATTSVASAPASIAAGPDGNLWFTESSINKIGKITPDGNVTEFASGISMSASPRGIVAGADGNLWFAESFSGNLARITPAGSVVEYALPTSNNGATGITAGPDGNLWVTESNADKVAKFVY